MRLKVEVCDGVLTAADRDCNDGLTLPSSFVSTTYAFRLRAVLGGQDAEIEVSRLQPVQAGTKTQWAGYLAFERS